MTLARYYFLNNYYVVDEPTGFSHSLIRAGRGGHKSNTLNFRSRRVASVTRGRRPPPEETRVRPSYRRHLNARRHGESFESEPRLCMGNSGYQPSVTCVSFRASRVTSAPPSPWLCSNPFWRSQSMTNSDRPSTSHAEYRSVWLYSGLQLCRTTRVLRFCSHRSFSRRYVLT